MKNAGIAHWNGGAIAVALIMIVFTSPGADQSKSANLDPNSTPRLDVHEWGTFTTLHGPGGNGLSWFQNTAGGVSELPSFVHSFGFGLKSRNLGPSTARMETPVLYFYTDQKQVVDVSANYVGGILTEFYPQKWQQLELIPPREAKHLIKKLPIDPELPENHYYEARAVPDAAFVRSVRGPDRDGKPRADEIEKFVFYRGVGSFDTRLMASLSQGGKLSLSHYNTEFGLKHAWVLKSSEEAIRWTKLDPIRPWTRTEPAPPVSVQLNEMNSHGIRENSVAALVDSMITALIDAGLTRAEATAMVATWDEQWYGEPGQRVFTIPPQSMINKILPLKISPKPSNIIRVFVQRQEILSPETMDALEFSMKPDTEAPRAREVIRQAQLGRFIHGALEAVADRVANRTRNQYYARGLKAIAPPRNWIDLDEEGSVVYLRANFIPSETKVPGELILTTEPGEEHLRIGIDAKGKTSLWVYHKKVEGPTIDPSREHSILLRIVSHRDDPDEAFLKISPRNKKNPEPTTENDWTLINRKGQSNANLVRVLVRGTGISGFQNIRITDSFSDLAQAPAVTPKLADRLPSQETEELALQR